MRTHQEIDRRSLALHAAVAEKLQQQPELLAVARANLERWRQGAGRSQAYLDAWEKILELPLEELTRQMLLPGEKMTAMRQASPFAGVLTPRERWRIYDAFADGARDPRGSDDRG